MNAARVDTASRVIEAPVLEVFRAFERPDAMEKWMPPVGMVARILHFDFREGGSYRMRLTYPAGDRGHGKSTETSDVVEVKPVSITEGREIQPEVEFQAEDPVFAGVMRMTWSFEAQGFGTVVSVRAENVPEGVRSEDHEEAMRSTLVNLGAFLSEGSRRGEPGSTG
jgi:uncharacterized protein YndB with AHSA1/START domain